MPVYLFTFHAYKSWMPDHARGYVERHKGIQPSNSRRAAQYRRAAKETNAEFGDGLQRSIIDEALNASKHQELRCHFIATDSTHVHLLMSWKTERCRDLVRKTLKTSLTRRLNRDAAKRTWFSRSGSRKRVRDQTHFDYLIGEYLPSHRGWKWCEGRGYFR